MINHIFFLYLVLINAVTFAVYALDKRKARHGGWRISECTLLLLATAGGAFGAYTAMKFFRHKTLHKKFTILVPLLIIIWLTIAVFLFGVTF